jgi:putative endonuclease
MRRAELGRMGEEIAKRFLHSRGYRILDTNYRSRSGEIDIICQNRDTVIFVEVKTRTSETFGAPAEAVNTRKQERLRRLAQEYLINHKLESWPVRFDILSLLFRPQDRDIQIEHITGAF